MIVKIAGDIGENEATFLGEVTRLVNVDQLDVFFEWGKQNEGFPNTTST